MRIDEAKKDYLREMKLKGYAQRTLENAGALLRVWENYLSERGVTTMEAVTEKEVKGYVRERYYVLNRWGRQNSPKSRNKEIGALKGLFGYLKRKGHIQTNPTEKTGYVQESKVRLPKDILTPREVRKILSLPDRETVLGYRDRVMLEVLVATGMRRKELCDLRLEGIRFKEGILAIRGGKGGKDRMVPVNGVCLKYLAHYVEVVRPKLVHPHSPVEVVFVSVSGKKIAERHLNEILKKPIERAKLKKRVTIHSFRHTVATQLLQRGMALRYVQELLGHEHLNTTVRYLQLTIGDLQREYRKCHPRERGN